MTQPRENPPVTWDNVATTDRMTANQHGRRETRVRREALRVVSEALAVRVALDLGDDATAATHARTTAALAAHVAATLNPDL